MKVYAFTEQELSDLMVWYRANGEKAFVTTSGVDEVLRNFRNELTQYKHPEHLTEQSTSKRDEVLRVATAIYAGYCANERIAQDIKTCTTIAINLIAEVDKRFNPAHP